MRFETMIKQRKYILIASGTGIVSLFFLFINVVGIISVSAINYGGLAYLVLLGFMLSGIVCLANNQAQPLDDLPLLLVVAGDATAAGILIFHFFQYSDMLNYIGIGFYLAIVSSLAIVYFSLVHRATNTQVETAENNSESGNDSLNNSDSQIVANPSLPFQPPKYLDRDSTFEK